MDFKEKAYNVFQMFNDEWALATAGSIDDYNTMTIAWGSMASRTWTTAGRASWTACAWPIRTLTRTRS